MLSPLGLAIVTPLLTTTSALSFWLPDPSFKRSRVRTTRRRFGARVVWLARAAVLDAVPLVGVLDCRTARSSLAVMVAATVDVWLVLRLRRLRRLVLLLCLLRSCQIEQWSLLFFFSSVDSSCFP
ncbi:hypothetical protein PF005_g22555 [Phytophthora fragariae]|uniref:Uncharacterized protein n=1 Tax=Phytophthora fragariae TaxID=53985 RepID=A0A6A3WGH8_9STRA|nr:hypothetical protein PF009_g22425 [Phytophthora fragariae]KAE9083781.1 hypothetical protein PF007_g21772 [Phytophthora fragariae]KAE9105854.1 hypothetical protein PF006_g21507 [Phytophthora fragariae]KAE9182287.1 hypothetical protein PF005_g22555 [Phytophthora fragariae]KAE9198074.1 hypothetical protein PF002_g22545 [Phytophthora fragariae]